MISPDEFLRRCEQVRAEFAVEGRARQQLTRELAALCALTGARAETLCDHNSQLTGLRVSDPGGNLVISGPVDEVLAELVAVPPSYQNRGPSSGARHRTRRSETAVQPAEQLVAIPTPYQNRGPSPDAGHRTLGSETAGHQAGQLVAGTAGPDAVRLDLVGIDESGKARGRWTSRVRSRGLWCETGGGQARGLARPRLAFDARKGIIVSVDTAELLLEARRSAGLTQAELARRAGTSQAMVARYETGVASPTVRTLRRLLRAADRDLELSSVASEAAIPPSPLATSLREHRAEITAAAERVGAHNVRIFGSVARGEDTADSDLDLLVDFPARERGLLPLLTLADQVERLVGRRVDVAAVEVMAEPVRDRALAEAVPL